MDARMKGLPVDVLHAFDDNGATMRVRLLSVRTMVDAKGAELTRAETVTLFNDLCVCAPGALVFADVTWEPIDAHRATGRWTSGVALGLETPRLFVGSAGIGLAPPRPARPPPRSSPSTQSPHPGGTDPNLMRPDAPSSASGTAPADSSRPDGDFDAHGATRPRLDRVAAQLESRPDTSRPDAHGATRPGDRVSA
jgi:hypothetical protein